MNEIVEIVTPDYIEEFSKSLCKIKLGNIYGTGFFMKTKIRTKKKKSFIF